VFEHRARSRPAGGGKGLIALGLGKLLLDAVELCDIRKRFSRSAALGRAGCRFVEVASCVGKAPGAT
jgi:hypothetical protein